MKNIRYGTLKTYKTVAVIAKLRLMGSPLLERRTSRTVRTTAKTKPKSASTAMPRENAASPIAAAMTGAIRRAHPQPPGL